MYLFHLLLREELFYWYPLCVWASQSRRCRHVLVNCHLYGTVLCNFYFYFSCINPFVVIFGIAVYFARRHRYNWRMAPGALRQ